MTSTTPPQVSPALPPSPLQLGQALSATFTVFKRRLGMFVGLAFVPTFIYFVLIAIGFAVTSVTLLAALSGSTYRAQQLTGGAIAVTVVVWLLVMAASIFVLIRGGGMLVLLANETANDRRPTLSDLWAGTKGIVARTLVFVLVAVVALGAFCTLVFVIMFAAVAAAVGSGSSRSGGSAAIGGVIGLFFLGYIAFIVVLIFLEIRWLYWGQGVAIERLDGFSALGNSWRLTKGNFWRTLGWYLVANLIVGTVSWVFVMVFSGLWAPVLQSAQSGSPALTGAATGASILFALLMTVLNALVAPLLSIYHTIMYVDQKRRTELAAGGGYPSQPYGQQYGYGQSPYPTPGQSPYPTPGQSSYPTPGQSSYPTPGQSPYPTPGQPSYPTPGQSPYPTPDQPPYGQQPPQGQPRPDAPDDPQPGHN